MYHATAATLTNSASGGYVDSVDSANGIYFLSASGNITSGGTYTPIVGSRVVLASSGTIGTSTTSALAVNAPNLTADATGSSFITDSQAVTLTDTGSFTNAVNTLTGTYFLNAGGNITSGSSYTPVAGNTMVLASSGTIGTSTSSPLAINMRNLTASAPNGSSFISDSRSVALVDTGSYTNTTNTSTGTYYFKC